ncbi:MAG: hypothetical protein BV458_13650 [Thermoplasmata archaeon M9B2D]|nr:MAG: hypothetical protein BV458_13650 [Thermoplasmata archaeon M9B2D]
MRYMFRFYFVFALFLLSVGCVSSSKHNACLTEVKTLDAENANLRNDLEETTHQKEELEQSVRSLQKENNELSDSTRRLTDLNANLNFLLDAKRDELIKTAADLQYKLSLKEKEIDELNREKADALKAKEEEISKLTSTYDNLVTELNKEIKEGEIAVTQLKDKLSLSLVEKILFDSGSAAIKSNGKKVLERVAEILRNVKDKQIRIEGHTDNVPIGPRIADRFPSNWELSTTRATNVVKFLIDNGIDPELISATGYSEYRPVAPNDTDEDRSKNRRIEIVLIPLDIDRVVLPPPSDNKTTQDK